MSAGAGCSQRSFWYSSAEFFRENSLNLTDHFWPFIAFGAMLIAAIGFSIIAVTLPGILGPRRTHNTIKDSAYECGLPA